MTKPDQRTHHVAFDSMAQCAAATGIPVAALKMAKAGGCDAFRSTRIDLLPFLRWWFAQQESDLNTDWSKELNKERTLRERIRRQEDEDRVIDFGTVHAFHGRLIGQLFADLDRVFGNELPPITQGRDAISIRTRALAEIEAIKTKLKQLLTEWENERHTSKE